MFRQQIPLRKERERKRKEVHLTEAKFLNTFISFSCRNFLTSSGEVSQICYEEGRGEDGLRDGSALPCSPCWALPQGKASAALSSSVLSWLRKEKSGGNTWENLLLTPGIRYVQVTAAGTRRQLEGSRWILSQKVIWEKQTEKMLSSSQTNNNQVAVDPASTPAETNVCSSLNPDRLALSTGTRPTGLILNEV